MQGSVNSKYKALRNLMEALRDHDYSVRERERVCVCVCVSRCIDVYMRCMFIVTLLTLSLLAHLSIHPSDLLHPMSCSAMQCDAM